MHDSEQTPLLRDRAAFAAFIEQLSQCSEAARGVVVNALRDRSIPTFMVAEISGVQQELNRQLTHAQRILDVWPGQ